MKNDLPLPNFICHTVDFFCGQGEGCRHWIDCHWLGNCSLRVDAPMTAASIAAMMKVNRQAVSETEHRAKVKILTRLIAARSDVIQDRRWDNVGTKSKLQCGSEEVEAIT